MYEKICFGRPFNFEYFINKIKDGEIIIDSGMNEGTSRNRCTFRSSYKVWDGLLIQHHEESLLHVFPSETQIDMQQHSQFA